MRYIELALLGCALATVACSDDKAPAGAGADAGEISLTKVSVGQFVFDVRVAGPLDGEVVMLLHGFPQSSYEWRHQMKALAEKGYRAVAPDQRGYSPGARPAAVEDYNAALLAADVTALADAIGAERFHIVGHDWGSAIAWVVAVFAPQRVISANAISVPHPDAFTAQLRDMSSCQYNASSYFDFFVTPAATDFFLANDAQQLRATFVGLSAEDIDVYVKAVGTPDAMNAALNWYRANVSNRVLTSPALGKVTVPTLFIWSDGDTFLCREGGELSEALVDAPYRFEVIPTVNHWVPENAADAVTSLLLEHIGTYGNTR